MLACVDVHYRQSAVVSACVCIADWPDSVSCLERVVVAQAAAADYVPGEFYRRELQYLLGVLEALPFVPETIVVDGYVSLGAARPGLGMHLFEALGRQASVVGVAKSLFHGATTAVPVTRGTSRRALYVSAAGMPVEIAAGNVRAMAGLHRIPDILKRADRLSRG